MVKVLDKQGIINSLKHLAQLDIDAYHAYGQAIERIKETAIREQLNKYRQDHHHHVTRISDKLRDLGTTPPQFSRDFKGYFIEGFTAFRSITGTKGALKAMQSNEKTTNKHYRQALEPELPNDIRALLEEHYEDEKRHLEYVEHQIELMK